MSTKYNRTIKKIVIHHMGDGKSSDVSILKRWNPYNYEFPEYDFGVEADGTIQIGRPLTYQGAHCIADKSKYNYSDQWWNKNSIGIGIAGDFTKFSMPQAQFNGLVKLVKQLMDQYNLTLDDVYPHMQVSSTSCPGCIYDKVSGSYGYWNYNDFEKAVNNFQENQQIQQEEVETVEEKYKIPIGSNITPLYGGYGWIESLLDQKRVIIHADKYNYVSIQSDGTYVYSKNGSVKLI
jgi:N-acetylmuramoyl-L-alanine amidase.